jgi:hypothetical protein
MQVRGTKGTQRGTTTHATLENGQGLEVPEREAFNSILDIVERLPFTARERVMSFAMEAIIRMQRNAPPATAAQVDWLTKEQAIQMTGASVQALNGWAASNKEYLNGEGLYNRTALETWNAKRQQKGARA